MKKQNKKRLLIIIFTIVVLLAAALTTMNKNMQNDTFYYIKVGEVIEKYGIDMKDHFSFIPNLRYTYPHWLFDLSVFKIYKHFGFDGLFIGSIIISTILSFTMFATIKKVTKNYGLAILITLFTFTVLKPFMTVRAQIVSYVLLLLISYCLEMLREKGNSRYIFYIGLLSILLASTHSAVYPIIFLLFLPILASDLLYKIFKGKDLNWILIIEKPTNTKKILITLLVCFLCGFVSPGLNTYLYAFLTFMGNSTSYIPEHSPTTVINNPFIIINLAIIIGIFLTKKTKINIRDFFTIGGFFILTLFSMRSYSLFLILTVYAFGRIFSSIENNYLKKTTITDAFNYRIIRIVLLLVFIPKAILVSSYELKVGYIDDSYIPIYPVEMVKYIKENMDYKNMRMFNQSDYGAYLLFNDLKVFIDTRCDLYMKEFNKGITAYDDAMNLPTNYKEFLKKYDFTHLLISKDTKLNYIIELLPEYKLIKDDAYFYLYEKIDNN